MTLALTACGGGGGKSASTTIATSTDTAAAVTSDTSETVKKIDTKPVDLQLPRGFTYAAIDFEVTAATRANVIPSTWNTSRKRASDDRFLFVEFTAGYVDDYPGNDAQIPIKNFLLVSPDGDTSRAEGVDTMGTVALKAGEDSPFTLAFHDPDGDLTGYQIHYDDRTHVPASVPLLGEVPTSPYPITVDVNEKASVEFKSGCTTGPAEVTLNSVEWDVDAGVEPDGKLIARGRSARALADTHFLRAHFTVVSGTGDCGGSTFPNENVFKAVLDGLRTGPVNPTSHSLNPGEGKEITYAFEVPDDTKQVEVLVGLDGATTHSFKITVPASLP